MVLAWLMLLALPGLATGQDPEQAPAFELPRLQDDGRLRLQDYRGTVVLLDFWASWCPPCRASLPAYDELRRDIRAEHGEEAFEVLAINLDLEREDALTFLDKHYQPDYPLLRESGYETQRNYNLMGMPTAFLIDHRGRIAHSWQGFSPEYKEELETRIEKLIRARGQHGKGKE
jgi:peroxiredoxin